MELADIAAKILDASDGGLDIYGELIDGFKDGKRNGYLNPAYKDTRGSLGIYEKGDRWRHHDHGAGEGGDAIDLYRQVHRLEIVDAFRELCARWGVEWPEGQGSQGAQQPARKRRAKDTTVKAYTPKQTHHLPARVLIEGDRPCILSDHLRKHWGRAGMMAAAKYQVLRADDYKTAGLVYADAFGRIATIKRTGYRYDKAGRLTKKDASGKGMIRGWTKPPEVVNGSSPWDRPAFGEHLLPVKGRRRHVVLVEAEDGALVAEAAQLIPGAIWLGMGGQTLQPSTLRLLRGHRVQWLPDMGAEDRAREASAKWTQREKIDIEVIPMGEVFDMITFRHIYGDKAADKADIRDAVEAASGCRG